MSVLRVFAVLALLSPAAQAVNLTSLLGEMVDRDALSRLPEPAYTCRQFSSYDRNAKDPQTDWFANGDVNQYLRVEDRDGRKEWVMMDTAGPGAIVRIWSANPPGDCRLRFYLDEQTEPAWTVDFQALTNGKGPVASPLSAVRSRGWNCYLPIPYAKHCKVTSDKPGFYYQLNYRTYAAGTSVDSFTPAALDAAKAELARVQAELAKPSAPKNGANLSAEGELSGQSSESIDLPAGAGAVRQISLKITPAQADADLPTVLRNLIVRAEFDGEDCVWVPVSDFFGSGVGINPVHTWYTDAAADGTLTCRWIMPYEKSGRLTLQNLGDQAVRIEATANVGPYTWDARSMHFHSQWRWQSPLATRPMTDWNYVTIDGQGVYLGDALAVFNPVTAWWGEGDEKVYVDGETFPSHFGTGTEDYYGYAWCDPTPFTAPFHAQPRCDGPANRGNTTVTRVRSLDAIPFTKSLRFDIECWHWADCKVIYAATTYWYGRPGAKSNRAPQPEGALATLPVPPPPFKLAGALEAEKLRVAAKSDGLATEVQGTEGYGEQWSGANHLWVKGRQAGDFVELELPADGDGARKLTYYGTKSWDYGIVKISVNGKTAVEKLDTWAEQVTPTGAVELGTFEPVGGKFVVRVEVVGRNDKSKGTGSFFGIDALVMNKP